MLPWVLDSSAGLTQEQDLPAQIALATSGAPAVSERARGTMNTTYVRKRKARWVGNSEEGETGDIAEAGAGF